MKQGTHNANHPLKEQQRKKIKIEIKIINIKIIKQNPDTSENKHRITEERQKNRCARVKKRERT
jgi:hypothetical protein